MNLLRVGSHVWKSISRGKSGLTAASVALLILCATGFAAAEGLSSDPVDFVGALLRKHSYLFEETTQVELDSLNRNLREAVAARKEATTEQARSEAEAAADVQEERLVSLLRGVSSTVTVDLATDGPNQASRIPVLLPGNVGGLLLRIAGGEEEHQYFTIDYTLAVTENSGPIAIEVAPLGTTWALVGLTDVPVGRTSLLFEFRSKTLGRVRWPLDVQVPQPARLKINILSPDTGGPTPAMVRLVWKTDGRDYRPSNAVDFTPQFDGQGRTSSRRMAYLPGRLHGYYWCVPGPLDMSVQPGEWEITIRRGLEHVPIFDSISMPEGMTLEKTYTPRRWVDMPARGWFSGDDHVHFRIMSDDDARRLMTWVKAEDVHLTNVARMGDVSRTFFEQRGFGPQYRIIDGEFVLSPGQEGPRTHGKQRLGHILGMNITSMVHDTSRYFLYDWVLDAVRKQGGLAGYAHGHRYSHAELDMSINIPGNRVDFVEVMQVAVLGTEIYYEFLNLGFKLTASAGSDAPFAGTVGEERVYAFLGKQPFSADSWFKAFGQGRTFVTNGPMIEFTVDGAVPGDEITVEGTRKLRVKARTWGDPERLTPTRLEIVRQGEVVQRVDSDSGDRELATSFELDAADGFWIAARAEGSDGSRAHTTPVYVVRDPLRFWKHEEVGNLIDKRLASLVRVREMVAQVLEHPAKTKDADSNSWEWWQLKRLAQQGPELLQRVTVAEQIYEELRQIHAQERSLRTTAR